MTQSENPMRLRLTLAVIGAIAGFFFWMLFEHLPDVISDQRLLMLLAAFIGSLFGGLLLMVGRLGLRAAARYAVGIALVSSLLLYWASFRFLDVSTFFDSIHPVFALIVLAHLPLPFAMAQETAPGGWLDYEGLFDHAWSILVRTITAWGFTGLFWLVIFLSDQLLELVGFEYLGEFVDHYWVSMPLTGIVVGLAMAVLNELKTVVSTLRRLALQLLRLLLPLVAVVVALFIVLVPFRGLEQVFGSLSAAGTMLAMAAGAVTLITSAVDARDGDAAHSRVMVMSAKALSVLLPIIAGISVYAIWVRVGQYGWTPARIAAGLTSLVVLAYALTYASSVLVGFAWRQRIRLANTWMAVSVIALSVLWLSPVLNVERISANNHLARFDDGRISVAELDVWRLGDDWGIAGQAALARIRQIKDHPSQVALSDKLARFDQGESRWSFEHDRGGSENTKDVARLKTILPVGPAGQLIPDGALEEIPRVTVGRILASCENQLVDGRPGCAAVIGSFSRAKEEHSVVLFWRSSSAAKTEIIVLDQVNVTGKFRYKRSVFSIGGDAEAQPAEELIAAVQNGDFRFAPARMDAVEINNIQILPRR